MKKYIIHIIFTFIIAFIKIYQIIFIDGFFGSLILTILKKVGFLILIYWFIVFLLVLIKKNKIKKD